MKKLSYWLFGIAIVFALVSCKTTEGGYGCKGKSKTKTGHKEEKFMGY